MENTKIYEPIKITCNRCGDEFIMSPAEQKYYEEKGFTIPKKCPKCRKLRSVVETRTCIDCNKEFTIDQIQKEFFEEQGFELPKRCPSCRKFRKERNDNNG